jgi:two-component system, OmpR family, response regulator
MIERPLRVLIVDDDASQLELLGRHFRLDGFEVQTTQNAIGVSNLVRSFAPDVVLIDVQIPALTGDRLLPLARKAAAPETKFVLFSACDEERLRRLARDVLADGWISKSWDGAQIARKIRQLCSKMQ